MVTLEDMERLASKYGFVPNTVLEDYRNEHTTDAERDQAQTVILRGYLRYRGLLQKSEGEK